MGIIPSVITLLIVTTVGRHVVSATNCEESNCELNAQEECRHFSDSVRCDMKNRPMKQINITASSFPRGVRYITITGAETITIGEDSIASLTSLEDIEINDVNTLILLPRSLVCGNESEAIKLSIREVKDLQLHSKTFEGWSGDSRITITEVDDCQLFPFSAAGAQFRGLTLSEIRSLAVHESAFSDNSLIEEITIMSIKSLSISKQAFTSNVTVHKTWIEDIDNLTIYSGALSRNSRMKEADLERVKYLNIEPDGIKADIDSLKVTDVAMETCGENAFAGNIASLSLSSSYIHRAKEHCISAGNEMNKLIIENSRFNHTETSAFYGTVREVQIKNSTFGAIEKEGLQLNVTKFSIECSDIVEASEKAFVVLADSDIMIRNCTINAVQMGAFSSLRVVKGNATADHRIQLGNLHIKRPQNGSLQFDQDQTVKVHDLKLDIPCTCDIATALGLDVSSEHEFWINQTFCEINSTRSTLGDYLEEFCTEPTTTAPPTSPTNSLRGGKSSLPPQTAGESNEQDPQTIPETRDQTSGDGSDQTSGDGSDQVRTGSTRNVALIATISVVGLIVLAVIAFFVGRHFRQRSRAEGQNGGRNRQTSESSQHALLDHSDHQHTDPHQVQFPTKLHPSSDQRTHGPDSRPTTSAPNQLQVPADSAPCQASDQGVPDSPTSVRTTTTHTSRGMERRKSPAGVRRRTNRSCDSSRQEMEDSIDSPTSAGPVSTYTSRGREQLEKGYQSPCLTPFGHQRGAVGGLPHGHGDYGGTPHYVTVPRPPPKPPQLVPLDSKYHAGGGLGELGRPPDERYKSSASYRMNQPKCPRNQAWGPGNEPETSV